MMGQIGMADEAQAVGAGAIIKRVGAGQRCEVHRSYSCQGDQVGDNVRAYIEKITGAMRIMALNAMHHKGLFDCTAKVLIGVCGHIRMAAQTKGIAGKHGIWIIDQVRALSRMGAVTNSALIGGR